MPNDLEGYPNMCIRCKQSYDHIELMTLTQRYGSNNFETQFPACALCKKKIMSHYKVKKAVKKSRYSFLVMIIGIVFFTFFSFLSVGFGSSYSIPLLMIISFFVLFLAILLLLPTLIVKRHPGNLSRYIKIKRNGAVVIKDPDFNNEMAKLQVNYVAEEVHDEIFGVEEENRLFCPKCGKEYRFGIPFCNTCGKDLRLLIN